MQETLVRLLGDWEWVLGLIAHVVLAASIIVRLTPTLRDDNVVLPVVKFIGKFVALNKYGPPEKDR